MGRTPEQQKRFETPEPPERRKLVLRGSSKPSGEAGGSDGLEELLEKARKKTGRISGRYFSALLALNVHPEDILDHLRAYLVKQTRADHPKLKTNSKEFRNAFDAKLAEEKLSYGKFLMGRAGSNTFVEFLSRNNYLPIIRYGTEKPPRVESVTIPVHSSKAGGFYAVAKRQGLEHDSQTLVGGDVYHFVYGPRATAMNFMVVHSIQQAVLKKGIKL